MGRRRTCTDNYGLFMPISFPVSFTSPYPSHPIKMWYSTISLSPFLHNTTELHRRRPKLGPSAQLLPGKRTRQPFKKCERSVSREMANFHNLAITQLDLSIYLSIFSEVLVPVKILPGPHCQWQLLSLEQYSQVAIFLQLCALVLEPVMPFECPSRFRIS